MIDYEGINYDLDSIIQFQLLKQFLEALAKRQINHNKLLYGKNEKNIINSDENFNNIKNLKISHKKVHSLFGNKENRVIENEDKNSNIINEEKIFIEKINNSGLIKEFIESQKQLIEHKKMINELIFRIEELEKTKETKDINIKEMKEKKEDKKNENDNKDIIDTNNYVIKKEEKLENIENENKDEDINIDIKNTNIITTKNELINNENINKELKYIISENKEIKNIDSKNENDVKDIKTQLIIFEENFKKINEQINKIKKDMDNNKKIIDFSQNEISHFKSSIQEKLENMKQIKEKDIKKIEENKNEDNKIEVMERKILKIIDSKYKELTNSKMENNMLKEFLKDKIKEQTEQITLDIKNLKEKNIELENIVGHLPDISTVKRIEERIKLLSCEMEEYATKKDIQYITNELNKFESELSKLKSFNISQNEINGKYREDILKIKYSFDNIKKNFSAINSLFENNSLSQIIENLDDITQKMVVKEEYNEYVKEISKIISILKMDVNDHNRKFDQIMPFFNKILTVEDLSKLENNLTELIEKKNEDASGKFANKKEIIKSIKSIESKVKIFMRNLSQEREKEKNEGAILASKPVGGYKCASCEAYIGDLKDSYTYLPWNKYHGEERFYRRGNSLSRILQGLNIENTYNPFIDKNDGKNINEKKISTEFLSVKNVQKVPPLLHVISEHNMVKNQNIEDIFNRRVIKENKKYPNRGILRIKHLKGHSNEINLSKSKNSNENSINKNSVKNKESEKNSTKRIFKSNINILKDNLDKQYYIPNL